MQGFANHLSYGRTTVTLIYNHVDTNILLLLGEAISVARKPAAALKSLKRIQNKPSTNDDSGTPTVEKSDPLKVVQWKKAKDSFAEWLVEYEKGLSVPGKRHERTKFTNSIIERKSDGSYALNKASPYLLVVFTYICI